MILDSLVPWRSRPNFRLDLSAATLAGLYVGGIYPFAAFVARDRLGASAAELGLMSSAPFLGSLIALPLTQLVTSGNPVKNISRFLWAARLIMIAASFTTGSVWFAVIIFMGQFLSALPGPTYAMVVRLMYPQAHRGRVMSYARTGMAAGMVTATVVAGALIAHFDWRWVFLGFAPFGLMAAAIYGRIRVPIAQMGMGRSDLLEFVGGALKLLRDDVSFRYFAIAVSVYGFGNLLATPVYTIYQVDSLHITAEWVAHLTNTSQVVWMLSYVFWGRRIDRQSPLKIVMINSLLAAVIPLNYLFATEPWMLMPGALVQGVVNAGIELSYFNSIMYFSSPATTAQYQGMHSMLMGVRGAIAPFIGAAFARQLISTGNDVRWVFFVGGLFTICGGLLQWYGLRHQAREGAGI